MIGAVLALHLTYALAGGPYRGTYEEWDTAAGLHREVTDIPGVYHEDAAYDGERAWTSDLSGVPHPLSGAARARLIAKAHEGSRLFSRWKETAGVDVPHRIERTEDVLTLQSASMESIDLEPPRVPSPMTRPSVVVPFETQAFHIFVPVRVNHGERQWFVLDTGADLSFVTHGLEAAKSIETSGSGGSVQAGMAANVDLQLGGVSVPLKVMGITPESGFSALWGRSFDGVAGYDVISRFVIRIDWTHRKLTLFDPAHFRYRGRGAVVPLRFQGNNIVIPVTVTVPDGTTKEIESVVDTGSSGALSFRGGFSPDVGKTIAAEGFGVGGASKTSIGRIRALTIGPYVLDEPIVELSHAKRGTEAESAVPASIGERILSRFTVYLDYAHERLILEPNVRLRDPFEADMSGLDLRAVDGGVRIVSVREGSAGAKAGLQPGDVILSTPISNLQELFRRPSNVTVEIERGGKTLHVVLRLRREV
ncbi:MAG TPA: hypothetical protein VGR95_00525 [Thermoanaerobaculia bacterium]|nr:hypothetical protein [Thermoanaerobaculia bacterium]